MLQVYCQVDPPTCEGKGTHEKLSCGYRFHSPDLFFCIFFYEQENDYADQYASAARESKIMLQAVLSSPPPYSQGNGEAREALL